MQDHARGLLSGDKVESKLYDLMFQSLEFERTLEHLSCAREEIRNQTLEVWRGRLSTVDVIHLQDICRMFWEVIFCTG